MKKKTNIRRMVGAILLLVFAFFMFCDVQSMKNVEWVGVVRQFEQFLYFYAAWAVGIAIWYLVTLKQTPNKRAEKIVKIIFFVVIILNIIYSSMLNFSDAGIFGLILIVIYSIACPWGRMGYKKHPYKEVNEEEKNE